MPIIAITREMGSLGKDVARALGAELKLPMVYHEVIDHLADRMRVRKSHVIRLLDGKAGLLERLTADQTSLSIFTADEIIGIAALRRAPETRAAEVAVSAESGRVTLSGAGGTDEMLAFVEVAAAVPDVRDVAYRTHPGEELRPRFH
jgi:Cytidylate kinase-like family